MSSEDRDEAILAMIVENAINLHVYEGPSLKVGLTEWAAYLAYVKQLRRENAAMRKFVAEIEEQVPCSTDVHGCPCCKIILPLVGELRAVIDQERVDEEGEEGQT